MWAYVSSKLLWCARHMFTCLVIVMCLLGRSWFASLNSSFFWCWFWLFRFVWFFYFDSRVGCYVLFLCWLLLAVFFRLLFGFFDLVLTLGAQLLLQYLCDCNGFVSELPMGLHRFFCSLYGFPLGICVISISRLMGGMPCF